MRRHKVLFLLSICALYSPGVASGQKLVTSEDLPKPDFTNKKIGDLVGGVVASRIEHTYDKVIGKPMDTFVDKLQNTIRQSAEKKAHELRGQSRPVGARLVLLQAKLTNAAIGIAKSRGRKRIKKLGKTAIRITVALSLVPLLASPLAPIAAPLAVLYGGYKIGKGARKIRKMLGIKPGPVGRQLDKVEKRRKERWDRQDKAIIKHVKKGASKIRRIFG